MSQVILALEALPSEDRADLARQLAAVALGFADRLEIDAVAADERSAREFKDEIAYLKSTPGESPQGRLPWPESRRGLLAYELSLDNDYERQLFINFSPWSIGATAYDDDVPVLAYNDGLSSFLIDRRFLADPTIRRWFDDRDIDVSDLMIDDE